MKTLIVKYLFLLAALGISIYVLLVKNSFTSTMLYAVSGLSLGYIILSLVEYSSAAKQEKPKHKLFVYVTSGMIAKRSIRIGAFIIASAILLFSGLKVLLFGVALLALLIGEVISLFVKLRNKMYYIYFEEKAIVFREDNIKRIFASHIREIEYRYEIFYLTLTNNQVNVIETDKVGKENQQEFIKEFVFWANTYQLPFTSEAKEKLGIS